MLAACTSSSTTSGTAATSNSTGPITIGASLSLSPNNGPFTADGLAFDKGYHLWAKDVNAHGGLLGRQVKLIILNDYGLVNQVVANYQTLFGKDHVDLAFGPFSSLLTGPASAVAARYGLAIADEMVPFVNYIASLPPSERPKTAAYPMAQDPFADPPVQLAEELLSN